ncbi:MAG: hypothetical protein U1D96_04890 [Eubacteriales bacterium]|nr:hypothetical protein [Bacillota bacterium]MBV1728615.1 hypothetical protein [Desulforudis sp.]MDZ4042814.1 hypothetical protein [Eubacteriales bacterium]MBU4554786.1 hypothetical protein [Bacillota bacterium]MBV1735955.1 hypothetical protein [Desulforudis sp.]
MITIEYLILWGTLALVNAGLAQSKNRSGLNWFLLSVVLGPVATFLLVVFCDHYGTRLIDDPPLRQVKRDGTGDA